jgi:hypothetical protein
MTEFGKLAVVIAMGTVAGIAMPAVVLPMAGPPGPVRVIFLADPNPASLPEGVSIDSWGRSSVLGGVDATAARALYAMGAVVVYPVRSHGCLGLRSAPHGRSG